MKLGQLQTLPVVKKTDFGVYLGSQEEKVLLPKKQVPEGTRNGDEIEVFIYRDSSDRLISTTTRPCAMVGEIGRFKVKEVGKIGAFLDWGLEKDLLLPFKEQTFRVSPGQEIYAAVYIDKSNRLAATMKLYPYLKTNAPYEKNEVVNGWVYEVLDRFGAYVAVDHCYSGMIPRQELHGDIRPGMEIEARVTAIRPDGKLTLSSRKKAYLQMDVDGENILKVVDEYAGVLPYDDKASPEVIMHDFQISKAAFKRAVGHLMKQGKIELKGGKIHKK